VNKFLKSAVHILPGRRLRFFAIFIAGFAASSLAGGSSNRLVSIPQLHAGQKFIYRVRYKVRRLTRSESHIATPFAPDEQDSDTERYVSVEIKKVETRKIETGRLPGAGANATVVMRTQLLPTDGTSRSADDGVVEFTLQEDGRADGLRGFDVLSPDEQAVWRQWVAKFALGWTFPAKGVKPGEKWKKEEPVVGTALSKLVWEKQLEYVRDAACPQSGDGAGEGTGSAPSTAKIDSQCAVVVTTATMKQQGPRDNSTPDDYKLHQLKTSGAALGKSDVLTFISLKTGFLQHASEDSVQTIDVVVAKADDSNKVHLNVEATSHAEVILVQ
jgi:hypothetical protein